MYGEWLKWKHKSIVFSGQLLAAWKDLKMNLITNTTQIELDSTGTLNFGMKTLRIYYIDKNPRIYW